MLEFGLLVFLILLIIISVYLMTVGKSKLETHVALMILISSCIGMIVSDMVGSLNLMFSFQAIGFFIGICYLMKESVKVFNREVKG